MKPKINFLHAIAWVWLAIALMFACAILYVAWQHNPQGEFHVLATEVNPEQPETVIHWSDWLMYGLSAFVVSGGPLPLIYLVVKMMRRHALPR